MTESFMVPCKSEMVEVRDLATGELRMVEVETPISCPEPKLFANFFSQEVMNDDIPDMVEQLAEERKREAAWRRFYRDRDLSFQQSPADREAYAEIRQKEKNQ